MIACSRLDDELRRLLQTKERQGTLFFLRVHLAVLGVLLVFSPLSSNSKASLIPTLLLLGTLCGLLIFLHAWVIRGGSVTLASLVVLTCDALAVTALPFVWLDSAGGHALIPASYLLKSVTGGLSLFLLVLAAMPIRPELPLFSAGTIFASQGYMLSLALADPRSQFGTSYVGALLGPQINWLGLLTESIYIAMTAVLLSLLTQRMRNALIEGVRMEKASGQLARYFSPEIAAKIQSESSDFLRPGGKLQHAAVLFADIRDFTTLSIGVSDRLSRAHGARDLCPRRHPG
jgi:adenylate cyclase